MTAKRAAAAASATPDVDAFLAALDHPREREIRAVRAMILGAAPTIGEGIKWNAPSFRTTEWFATFHLRARDGVQLVLHLGARVRDAATTGIAVADPDGLLEWLARDRATVRFRDLAEVEARRDALAALVRAWIAHV
jgi:hypothetical protein